MASKPHGVEVHDRNLKPPLPDPDDVTEEDQRLALLAAEPEPRGVMAHDSQLRALQHAAGSAMEPPVAADETLGGGDGGAAAASLLRTALAAAAAGDAPDDDDDDACCARRDDEPAPLLSKEQATQRGEGEAEARAQREHRGRGAAPQHAYLHTWD